MEIRVILKIRVEGYDQENRLRQLNNVNTGEGRVVFDAPCLQPKGMTLYFPLGRALAALKEFGMPVKVGRQILEHYSHWKVKEHFDYWEVGESGSAWTGIECVGENPFGHPNLRYADLTDQPGEEG